MLIRRQALVRRSHSAAVITAVHFDAPALQHTAASLCVVTDSCQAIAKATKTWATKKVNGCTPRLTATDPHNAYFCTFALLFLFLRPNVLSSAACTQVLAVRLHALVPCCCSQIPGHGLIITRRRLAFPWYLRFGLLACFVYLFRGLDRYFRSHR